MLKKAKMMLVVLILSGIGFNAMADKGIGKKNKSKIALNINAGNLSKRLPRALDIASGHDHPTAGAAQHADGLAAEAGIAAGHDGVLVGKINASDNLVRGRYGAKAGPERDLMSTHMYGHRLYGLAEKSGSRAAFSGSDRQNRRKGLARHPPA